MGNSITKADVSEYLDSQSDFDLELFVYRSLLNLGYQVTHGGFYIDPVTSKARQFDIRASMTTHELCGIKLAIECKSLAEDCPLIISRVPRPTDESFHNLQCSFGNPVFHQSTTITMPSIGPWQQLYPPDEMIGKKADQIKKESNGGVKKVGDQESYEKWSQALASSAELIRETLGANLDHRQHRFFTLVLPFLVVSDRTLWVADYTDAGARDGDPHMADETTLWVDRLYPYGPSGQTYKIGHLHIYTRQGFLTFLNTTVRSTNFQERAFGFAIRSKLGQE